MATRIFKMCLFYGFMVSIRATVGKEISRIKSHFFDKKRQNERRVKAE